MEFVITTKHLHKSFIRYNKEEGFIEALKSVIHRKWDIIEAVKDISFNIAVGEFVGFVGPNGAGKTTTLKMLSGILHPTSGSCKVLGFTPHKRPIDFRKSISLVMGQKSQLFWDLPPIDTFLLLKDIYQIKFNKWKLQLDELVELLNIQHILKSPTRQLSLGERMKCEFVAALLHEPKLLFLDEPTIGMDVISQQKLWEFIKNYQKKYNTTIILSSHYMQDVVNLCSRIILINHGTLVYDGSLNDLVSLSQPNKIAILKFQSKILDKHFEDLSQWLLEVEKIDSFTIRISLSQEYFWRVLPEIISTFPLQDLIIEDTDFSSIMSKAFEFTAEEMPLRIISKDFKKQIHGKVEIIR